MSVKFESPQSCRWCGVAHRNHGRRWAPIIGMHAWLQPSEAMVLERMKRRRADRQAAKPSTYHAATAWAASGDGEEGIPYCADCQVDGCRLWMRIQARLDRIRWGGGEPW